MALIVPWTLGPSLGSALLAGGGMPSGSTDVTVRGLPPAPSAQVETLAQTGTDALPWALVLAGAAVILLACSLLIVAGRSDHGNP